MKTVMCFGTFDILHLGHLNYFQQAKKYGDYLIVVIARDLTKRKMKKRTIFSEKERLQLIKNLRIVDEAVLGNKKDFLKIIRRKKPAVICLGYDHPTKEILLQEQLQKLGLKPLIKRLRSYCPYKHKSTKYRKLFFE